MAPGQPSRRQSGRAAQAGYGAPRYTVHRAVGPRRAARPRTRRATAHSHRRPSSRCSARGNAPLHAPALHSASPRPPPPC
eukprot:2625736-Prymnesium_polylepis.1